MRCPACSGRKSEVVWTWLNTTGRVRVRKHRCLACHHEWRTQERDEAPGQGESRP